MASPALIPIFDPLLTASTLGRPLGSSFLFVCLPKFNPNLFTRTEQSES
ncbi:hypothetical protein D082_02210 [Synechocystis sp. PCC 6714]|nr:hypothetical protein D082_02210 [Synechocystis sp. PCC 6714]